MAKEEAEEKRGPVEKGAKGWPINPFGVVALAIFGIVVVLFIVRPLISQKAPAIVDQSANSEGGSIKNPSAGDIVRTNSLNIELAVDEPDKVEKAQFWAKTYADGKWQVIGEASSPPFTLDWQIASDFRNKAIALTAHIYQKDGKVIKDPGGWREGIIILGP